MSEQHASGWLLLIPVAANIASLAASATLLTWVWCLKAPLARKLMARQLWQLALADLFVCVLNCVWLTLELLHTVFGFASKSSPALEAACIVGMSNNVPGMVSVLIEVHMATATVASLFRFTKALRLLSRILPLAWPAGFSLGAAIVVLSDGYWDPKRGLCNSASLHGEALHVGTLGAALTICTGAYFVSVVMAARQAGVSVETRMWRRARWFVVAGMISWLPFVLFICIFAGPGSMVGAGDDPTFFVAVGFLDSNGLLNAAVYAYQCRYLRRHPTARGREGTSSRHSGLSFCVAFDSEAASCVGFQSLTSSAAPADATNAGDAIHTGESFPEEAASRRGSNPEGELLTFVDEPTASIQ